MGEASVQSDSQPKQLTPEQIRRLRVAGLLGSPFRVALALLALSLVGGLPWNLYAAPHGWLLAALVLCKDLAEYIARVPALTGRQAPEPSQTSHEPQSLFGSASSGTSQQVSMCPETLHDIQMAVHVASLMIIWLYFW